MGAALGPLQVGSKRDFKVGNRGGTDKRKSTTGSIKRSVCVAESTKSQAASCRYV